MRYESLPQWLLAVEEAAMRMLLGAKRHDDKLFHSHPFHSLFALLTSFILTVMVVLILAMSAE